MKRTKINLEDTNRIFFSIKEVAAHFGINESNLRFWEKEFDIINPNKSSTGIRQYTRKDIEDIAVVYHLVKEKGLTLEGARQTLKLKKDEEMRKQEVIERLENIRKELKNMEIALEGNNNPQN